MGPFIKWVGGKRQLMDALLKHAPETYGTFYEPFLGGAALFFALRPKKAVLGDTNERLVRTYLGVQQKVEDVIALLRTYKYERTFFEKTRARKIDDATDAEVAAWFIYLNKCGFNGLYRVNSKNIFNVPFGRYTNPNICDEDTLRACSKALKAAKIIFGDFQKVTSAAKANDFVYFDPPYIPLSATSSFTSYTAGGFSHDDQERLRDHALGLKKKKVHVLLSNSSAPAVRELYEGFTLEEVDARRSVNSRGASRGAIAELLMW